MYSQQFDNFDNDDIRQYWDALEKSNASPSKRICPVCGGNDLDISKDGKFQCFSGGCDTKEIYKAAKQLAGAFVENGNALRAVSNHLLPRSQPTIPPCPELVTYPEARDHTPGFFYFEYKGQAHRAWRYDRERFVHREDLPEKKENGKPKKLFKQHCNKNWGKGEDPWPIYNLRSAKELGQKKVLLLPEGEQGCDTLAKLALVGVTPQGSSRKPDDMVAALMPLKGEVAAIAELIDNDDKGYLNSENTKAACEFMGIIYLPIPTTSLWPDCPKGGDITDWLEAGLASKEAIEIAIVGAWREHHLLQQGRSRPPKLHAVSDRHLSFKEVAKQVTSVLALRLTKIEEMGALLPIKSQSGLSHTEFQQLVRGCRDDSKEEEVSRSLEDYRIETNPIKRSLIKSKICGQFHLSGFDFQRLAEAAEIQERKPAKTLYTIAELMNKTTTDIQWLVPGLVPQGEMVLLAAPAKSGKTLLASDLTHATLEGSEFLGEKAKKGKVLLVCSDQSVSSTIARLRLRGTNEIPDVEENFKFLSHLDITDLSELETILEDFRPDLVVLDSLTSITQNLDISENDAAIAKPLIRLRDTIQRYGASSLLIHHESKSKDNKGIHKIGGSARITSVPWAMWQLSGTVGEDGEIKGESRYLTITPRDGERTNYLMAIKPRDEWLSGIYECRGEIGVDDETKSLSDRITDLLRKYSPNGLEVVEMTGYLNANRDSVYKALNRLEARKTIGKRRSQTDQRAWVYYISPVSGDNILHDKENIPPPLDKNPKTRPITDETIDIHGLQELDTCWTLTENNWTSIGHNVDIQPDVQHLKPLHDNDCSQLLDASSKIEGGGVFFAEPDALDVLQDPPTEPLPGSDPEPQASDRYGQNGQTDAENNGKIDQPEPPPELEPENADSSRAVLLASRSRTDLDEAKEVIRELFGTEGLNQIARGLSQEQKQRLARLPSTDRAPKHGDRVLYRLDWQGDFTISGRYIGPEMGDRHWVCKQEYFKPGMKGSTQFCSRPQLENFIVQEMEELE